MVKQPPKMPTEQGTAAPFDRARVKARRTRLLEDGPAEFLYEESAARLIDRLDDTTRDFNNAVEIGGRLGALTRLLTAHAKIAQATVIDSHPGLALALSRYAPAICGDEEALPVAEQSVDLIASNAVLQTINDLPGALVQIRRALKPDGLFVATLFGGATLHELRTALSEAEMEITGGLSPRVAPFVDVRDAGNLLGRAGFALPVSDTDTLTVSYDHLFALIRDLRAMGATNMLNARARAIPPRTLFMRAAEIYAQKFAREDGRIIATVELLTLTGWAPSETQPKALSPGSAQHSLADALSDATDKENNG